MRVSKKLGNALISSNAHAYRLSKQMAGNGMSELEVEKVKRLLADVRAGVSTVKDSVQSWRERCVTLQPFLQASH